jgi:hypothetical protein
MGLIGLNLGDMSKAEILLMIFSSLLIAPFGALILLICHKRYHNSVVILPDEQYTDLPLTNQPPTEREPDHDPQGLPADR